MLILYLDVKISLVFTGWCSHAVYLHLRLFEFGQYLIITSVAVRRGAGKYFMKQKSAVL